MLKSGKQLRSGDKLRLVDEDGAVVYVPISELRPCDYSSRSRVLVFDDVNQPLLINTEWVYSVAGEEPQHAAEDAQHSLGQVAELFRLLRDTVTAIVRNLEDVENV